MTARTKKLGSTPHHAESARFAKLAVWVQPGAKRSEIVGFVVDRNAWHVRLAARATENQANCELISVLADALGVAQKHVVIVAGHTARAKLLRIEGLDADRARERLTALAAAENAGRT
jgi:uncharacterized protein (TIGR00251 family)